MIDANLYLNLIRGGAARLAQNRQTINDLNVFPIPDGDTGDNMYMTLEAGTRAQGAKLSEMADAVSQGMLMGARGNSGVILSRIFAGMAKGLRGAEKADPDRFLKALQCGVTEAYHAVSQPVEGTILTVMREGVAAIDDTSSLDTLFNRWIAGMEVSLERTPELLDVLKKAGVVDSGGAGLLCIVEGMRDALHGKSPIGVGDDSSVTAGANGPTTAPKVDFNAFTEDTVLEFGYCTEFLLRLQRSKVDLEHFDESVISNWLQTQGDSLVFFRDGSIIKVHVHTMDPGAVLTRCRQWGEFLTIKVENMTLQHHENHMDVRFKRSRKALGLVVVATGKGLTDTFKEMGADIVIEGGQTMNPPVERFLEAFDQVDAEQVLVFPNNGNIVLTAQQAAALYKDSQVQVIPTKSLGEGYFALANLEPEMTPEEMVPALTEAAASVNTGLVSRAIRDSAEARTGDYIGFSGKDILTAGPERLQTALELAGKLDAGSADILIVFRGLDAPQEEAQALCSALEQRFPRTEVILREGGQPIYDYILVTC